MRGPADDEPVWRYVHLPKLVDLLARRRLPLVRVDLLGDRWTLVAPVQYLDCETGRLAAHHLAYPPLCKRSEFTHEREVRVHRFRVDESTARLQRRSPSELSSAAVEYLPVDPDWA